MQWRSGATHLGGMATDDMHARTCPPCPRACTSPLQHVLQLKRCAPARLQTACNSRPLAGPLPRSPAPSAGWGNGHGKQNSKSIAAQGQATPFRCIYTYFVRHHHLSWGRRSVLAPGTSGVANPTCRYGSTCFFCSSRSIAMIYTTVMCNSSRVTALGMAWVGSLGTQSAF